MKKRSLSLILVILSTVSSYAQVLNYNVSIDSVRFSEQVTFTIVVNFGDSLNFDFLDVRGEILAHLPKAPVYKSQNFILEIDSINNGVYVTALKVNSKQMYNRLLREGDTKRTTVNLHVEVLEWGFDQLTIYPNPTTSSELNIKVASSEESLRLRIFNLEGKKLFVKRLNNSTGLINEVIDISSFDEGYYIVELISTKGRTTQPFIKKGS